MITLATYSFFERSIHLRDMAVPTTTFGNRRTRRRRRSVRHVGTASPYLGLGLCRRCDRLSVVARIEYRWGMGLDDFNTRNRKYGLADGNDVSNPVRRKSSDGRANGDDIECRALWSFFIRLLGDFFFGSVQACARTDRPAPFCAP